MMFEFLLPAFLVGLFGAGHCAGMCGGIGAALSFGSSDSGGSQLTRLLFYNLGRISSYTIMGLVVGTMSYSVGSSLLRQESLPILRLVAGLMIILMGLYVAGWWRVLSRLEKIGGYLWRRLQPISSRFLPVRSVHSAFIVGCLWGWLPCGLVYSGVAMAMSIAHPLGSALAMLAFGLGTLPTLLMVGFTGDKLKVFLQRTGVRAFAGLFLIVFGCWTLFFAMHHSHVEHNHMHDEHHAH